MQRHTYHLVDKSPWPFFLSCSLLYLTTGFVMYMHFFQFGNNLAIFGFSFLLIIMIFWWRDVIRESSYLGFHTNFVQNGIKLGFILFIISEIMFFIAFFWSFFHSSLTPSIFVGATWPPSGYLVFDAFGVALLNTITLLVSGAAVTWSHRAILSNKFELAIQALILTILLASFFIAMQIIEYLTSPFSISDGVYGSSFYMLTGLHGCHVIVGTIFLFITLIRLIFIQFSPNQHLGFEFAAWYWHFVDVVWLILYISVYCWGNY